MIHLGHHIVPERRKDCTASDEGQETTWYFLLKRDVRLFLPSLPDVHTICPHTKCTLMPNINKFI